ncbi:asparaginase [Pseudonocardia acaciae]|uniref:asparaginase n=1 Tax=Pseudonocardia acaciae TaxID=551276 RepID=UPI000683F9A4|nr:asparaginase [Pseudonocardia acaciae]
MTHAHVAIASLGGTITMTGQGGGVTPTLGADELIAAVPELARVATIEATTLASLPGASLSFDDVLAALRWADDAVAGGASGAVLIQGTDTLPETAYLLDLHWRRPEPLVVTGAMRPAGVPGADGPANLLAAVRVAARCTSVGAVVVMNDEVHAAARVRKSHAFSLAAFTSPDFGPLGVLVEGSPVLGHPPHRWPALAPPPPGLEHPEVAVVDACLGDDGRLLRLARSGGYRGAVVSAFGAGHVPFALADAVGDALDGDMAVVFASRTGAGTTLNGTYGFAGSERDLIGRGAVPAGWLDPHKARILLWALLAARASPERIRDEFARRGGPPVPG